MKRIRKKKNDQFENKKRNEEHIKFLFEKNREALYNFGKMFWASFIMNVFHQNYQINLIKRFFFP